MQKVNWNGIGSIVWLIQSSYFPIDAQLKIFDSHQKLLSEATLVKWSVLFSHVCSPLEHHGEWESICLKRNHIEGISVYSRNIIVKGSVVCNYGGYLMNKEAAEKAMNQYDTSKFLLK